MRIMAVDDDPIILELLREVIGSMPEHDIVTADGAAETFAILGADDAPHIDCFLLDIQMPETDGIELCQALRRCGEFTLTPILMLTAMNEKHYIDRAFAAGANDYVTKPFEVNDIQLRIREAAQRATHLTEQLEAFESDAGYEVKPNLLEQVHLFDITNVIDYSALENYVQMMSRRSLAGSVVLGFHIRRISEIHEACTSMEFRGLIEDVAETISDQLRDYQVLMSYSGNGTFLCVIEENKIPNCRNLVDNVNLALHSLDLMVPTPSGSPIRVCCGDMLRLLGRPPELTLHALIEARSSSEKTAHEIENGLDAFWYMGRLA